MPSAKEMLDVAIADLEARLSLKPGQGIKGGSGDKKQSGDNKANNNNNNKKQEPRGGGKKNQSVDVVEEQPDICKLEFKVGVITKVWNHPEADKLYCEEIDVGEESPRLIASGLRPHFTLEQMQGQRLLVVANLKPKNLVKFKSHGMVLCAAAPNDGDGGGERVEFIEPPEGATIGEVVTFEGLPPPKPLAPSQVEKNKVFIACAEHMKTTGDCVAAWKDHIFMTSAGPCKARTIAGGAMR
jgi:aminoacyl tRNA synthase complex-interacting multifunctional protein 1